MIQPFWVFGGFLFEGIDSLFGHDYWKFKCKTNLKAEHSANERLDFHFWNYIFLEKLLLILFSISDAWILFLFQWKFFGACCRFVGANDGSQFKRYFG